MAITFETLHESHFTLLLKWLETPHVKKWWDEDVTLAIYKTTEDGIASLRSSIWQRYGDEWQMIFHQGTKCEVKDGREE